MPLGENGYQNVTQAVCESIFNETRVKLGRRFISSKMNVLKCYWDQIGDLEAVSMEELHTTHETEKELNGLLDSESSS